MDREALATLARNMRLKAADFVQQYAAARCLNVSEKDVRAIAGAVGEISIDEACAALDRIDRQNRSQTAGVVNPS
jgi:ribosomal protein L22